MELLVSLISGAVGGNIAGGLLKNHNLGLLGNSIAGVVGGGLGGRVLSLAGVEQLATATGGELDTALLATQAAGAGAGGAVAMIIVSTLRNLLTR